MLFGILKENVKLTLPILLTRLLGITSNTIAMVIMAKLGTEVLSASALVMGIFSVCVLLVMSFSFTLCAIIAEACSSNHDEQVGAMISSSMLLNTLLALPFMVLFYYIARVLIWLGQPEEVACLVKLYFHGMLFGYLPLIWASILEQFFIGIGKPRYIILLSLISLLLMPVLTDIFMYGRFGLPALGMLGAGYAVSMMSIISLIFLIAIIMSYKWHRKYHLIGVRAKCDFVLIKKLYRLGWPIALQFSGEFLAYMFITVMMGWLGIIELAAQQIILQFTTVIVMIPTSVSQATAVLVGMARGRGDISLVKYHVNIGLGIVTTLMVLIALVYLIFPQMLINIYLETNNPHYSAVLSLTTVLLLITAISQCFDGIRNVLVGGYRGLQETRKPMMISTIMLWSISIPLAYFLGFVLQKGAVGVRWGFTIGIMLGAIFITLCWYVDLLKRNRISAPVPNLDRPWDPQPS